VSCLSTSPTSLSFTDQIKPNQINKSTQINNLNKMGTLWLVDTLNNWEQPMFVNVYGCDLYGYGGGSGRMMGETSFRLPGECTKPRALGGVASAYFCLVAALGGLVLPTLLTAVITASTVS
jgi:hypothetical protein